MDEEGLPLVGTETADLPEATTCTLKSGETAWFVGSGIKLPNGSVVKDLSNCILEPNSIIAFSYGDDKELEVKKGPNTRKTAAQHIDSVNIQEISTETRYPNEITISTDNTTTNAATVDVVDPAVENQEIPLATIVVVAAAAILAVSAIGSGKSTRIRSGSEKLKVQTSSQHQQEEQRKCSTQSDTVMQKISETISLTSAGKASKISIQDPEWLYAEISAAITEVYAIGKFINKQREASLDKHRRPR